MNERQRLERIAGLLQLVQLDLNGCGECAGPVRERVDVVVGLVNELLGIPPRHAEPPHVG